MEETSKTDKILVTYASRFGSTAEVAQAIGKTLAEGGQAVDVLPMQAVTDLAAYRAVVAGSAIQGGKWLPEAMKFMRAHQSELARRPFASFMVCITLGMRDADKYRQGLSAWMAPVRALVKPVSEGLFAGSLDVSRLPLTFNAVLLRLAVAFGALPKGEHRDWDAIHEWAASLRPLLVR